MAMASSEQPYSQTYLDAAHLLRRAGFGATPDQIQAAAGRGLQQTTRDLLTFKATPDNIDDDAVIEQLKSALPEAAKDIAELRLPVLLVKVWWTYRMVASQHPLQEKMVLFWHNHFTSKDGNGSLMLQQNQLFREYALGNFRTLTLAVSKNPEMLQYLNGAQNYKAHPNENYARELMEIFTCGRVGPDGKPNYSEDDIKNSARAFSGWNSRRNAFYYNPNQHDDTVKTFLGQTGDLGGDDIVDILVALPATAYYMCRKLFRYFAYDDPEPEVMDVLVKTYFDTGYEIQPIVEQILTSNAFYSAKARKAIIKSPADLVIGTVRMLGLQTAFAPAPTELFGDSPDGTPAPAQPLLRPRLAIAAGPMRARRGPLASPIARLVFLVNQMRNMGQDLLAPPTVKGWDGGKMWINTDTLQARERFATALSALPDLDSTPLATEVSQSLTTQPASFGRNVSDADAARIIDDVLNQLGPLIVSDQTRQALMDYATHESNVEQCARGILSLAMATPDYQLA